MVSKYKPNLSADTQVNKLWVVLPKMLSRAIEGIARVILPTCNFYTTHQL